jgi:hypothetical protein
VLEEQLIRELQTGLLFMVMLVGLDTTLVVAAAVAAVLVVQVTVQTNNHLVMVKQVMVGLV